MSDDLVFQPFTFNAEIGFWKRLMELKLDVHRLQNPEITTRMHYTTRGSLLATADAFEEDHVSPKGFCRVNGITRTFNTSAEFKEALATAKTEDLKKAVDIMQASDEHIRFVLFVFMDIKKYQFYYAISVPLVTMSVPPKIINRPKPGDEALMRKMSLIMIDRSEVPVFFVCDNYPDEKKDENFIPDEVICFVDHNDRGPEPGWALRNYIMKCPTKKKVKVLAFRDMQLNRMPEGTEIKSLEYDIEIRGDLKQDILGGWIKADKSHIHKLDLVRYLDMKTIASNAVDLNIKLIQWRILPSFDPSLIQEKKFLLLGSGTLGCAVARNLVAWGVRHITFVDNGHVSYSNPVRQSLFTHNDAVDRRFKAEVAVERLKEVMPELVGESHNISIPMPGHKIPDEELSAVYEKLNGLINSHDVVFQLTDSRESRWLPTLLIANSKKENPPLGVCVALGFDSFLVLTQSYGKDNSACYFCNDVTAPTDTTTDRTLDQQCTVTRPGLTGMAAGVAVELVCTLAQHKDHFRAPRTIKDNTHNGSMLGATPTMIRGYLNTFQIDASVSEAVDYCMCCSRAIGECFEEKGLDFLKIAVSDSNGLEKISGLEEVKAKLANLDLQGLDDWE